MTESTKTQTTKETEDDGADTALQEREHMLQSTDQNNEQGSIMVQPQPVVMSSIPDEPPPPYPGLPLDNQIPVQYQPQRQPFPQVPGQYVEYTPVGRQHPHQHQMPYGQTTITIQQIQRSVQDRERKPNSYIALSFITCMCCNMPFGLVGLIFSAMSESHFANHRQKESRETGKYALMCDLAGIIVSISTAVFILAMSPARS